MSYIIDMVKSIPIERLSSIKKQFSIYLSLPEFLELELVSRSFNLQGTSTLVRKILRYAIREQDYEKYIKETE